MLANVCVEHRYEVSLYRHSAFFYNYLGFLFMPLPGFSCLCHCPVFLIYVISRRSSLSVIARTP